ncbi:AIPR family protein [Tropicibacter naphthalenivorans]|uniref:AIPR protein n=1 Tax=Tropicibacter naphthalenivorans TaxID=441103 RepID=A0A0P1GKI4_9RHOB|nr:AIPR family protein [Tropicibacter naphthalenivorans]CUH82526.1 AIPR protein [Tropicibacter naphthalenivorans]SMD10611.1 AIPR protein [Tropicibacter naphthalenivorans]
MASNSEVILSQILEDKRLEVASEMSKEDFFEIFCGEQATKDYELSYEEIEQGIVDGEHDGGIDGFYVLLNDDYVTEDFDYTSIKKTANIEVIIVQSKSSKGFSETPINSLISSIGHLLDLTTDLNDLTQYNEEVRSKAGIFRKCYTRLASKFPSLSIKVIYACTKSTDDIHNNTKLKSKELVDKVSSLFDEAEVKFYFWGAKEIVALARKKPTQTFDLTFEQALNGSGGYIALVKLDRFFEFLCAGGEEIRTDLFEANVRDYQGSTEVNREISTTLETESERDFWWFNNGVTVLASRATSSGSCITIENPQIVNGLQTSTEIGKYRKTRDNAEKRSVMVKVVASEDDEIRDKIIKATNSQNTVPSASLRATDKIQRDIEHHLKNNGLYYDRRKNFYKNEGRPANKIVSISLLAQAAMTLFRGEPDNARARPSSIIKVDSVYTSIFTEDYPLDAYFVAADTIKRVEVELKKKPELVSKDRNNIRFYVLYWVIAMAAHSLSLTPQRVANLRGNISDGAINKAIDEVWLMFQGEGASDQVAKGPKFKEKIKDCVKDRIIAAKSVNSTQDTN